MVPAFAPPLTAVPVSFQPLSATPANIRSRAGSVSSKLDFLSRPRLAQTNATLASSHLSFRVAFGWNNWLTPQQQQYGSELHVRTSGKPSHHSCSAKVLLYHV